MLIILYYLSQNPDFERSVKPLLSKLKNSEQALKFLEELSHFSKLFSSLQGKNGGGRDEFKGNKQTSPPNFSNGGSSESGKASSVNQESSSTESKHRESPTSGIADGFIEDLLEKYFKSRSTSQS